MSVAWINKISKIIHESSMGGSDTNCRDSINQPNLNLTDNHES